MLIDRESGQLMALMDTSPLGPVRVGAVGGIGARHLAPKDAKVLGILGSGRQARTQLPAVLNAVPGIEKVKVYSPTQEHREAYAKEMGDWLGREIEPVASAQEAIDGADVVDLINTSRSPIFELGWVKPGALVITMTGRGEVPDDFLHGTRMVCPNWDGLISSQLREPYFTGFKEGKYSKEDFGGELGELIKSGNDPRRDPSEIVDYEGTAGASFDHAIADWAYRWARSKGIGQEFSISE
jgi:ornithine cyclodeaminase/alanine dehydrogenase-like protein (mu-crystallin family)